MIGVPDEKWIEAIAAVVVLSGAVDERELLEFARTKLAAHKVPKSIHVVETLPKNPSGKLLKRELRKEISGVESAIGR
ncbi:MAG: hypothetical protein R2705_15085 [Ilumatobacteraceae bacterium]